MGKQGPCRHCGVTSTPLWRNGPPEKPVLCNACGSRWRTKGSLTNYTPLHARELLDPEEFKVSKVRSICFKAKDSQSHKKKQNNDIVESEHEMPYSDQNFRKIFDGDTSNRSSSGSAISYSESCAYFGNTDASDLTGSAQSNVWDSLVPSKKRTCVARPKPSPVEKLTKDLHSILHEQQSSYLSGSSHEDLLYESATPIGSAEIGHGGVLLRYPNSKTIEEESEASSLPTDTKSYLINESYSGPTSFLVHTESEGTSFSNAGIENFKKPTSQVAQGHVKRDKVSHEKLNILQGRDSPLTSTDLTKSKWVEHCKNLKDVKQKQITGGKNIATGPCSLGYSNLTPLKRPRYNQIQYDQAEKGTMRSPKRVSKSGDMNLSSTKSSQLNCDDAGSKIIQDTDDFIDSEGACFSPRSIFASPPDRSSMMVSLQFTDESSDQDLLFDVPSNASFPEAELLLNPLIRMTAPNSSPAESGAAEGEESLSNKPSSSFSNQHQRHR